MYTDLWDGEVVFFMFIIIFFDRERERTHMHLQGGEGQREGDIEPTAGSSWLKLTNHETTARAECVQLTNWAIQVFQDVKFYLQRHWCNKYRMAQICNYC